MRLTLENKETKISGGVGRVDGRSVRTLLGASGSSSVCADGVRGGSYPLQCPGRSPAQPTPWTEGAAGERVPEDVWVDGQRCFSPKPPMSAFPAPQNITKSFAFGVLNCSFYL